MFPVGRGFKKDMDTEGMDTQCVAFGRKRVVVISNIYIYKYIFTYLYINNIDIVIAMSAVSMFNFLDVGEFPPRHGSLARFFTGIRTHQVGGKEK